VVLTCALGPDIELRFTILSKYGTLNAKGEVAIVVYLSTFKYILGFHLRLKRIIWCGHRDTSIVSLKLVLTSYILNQTFEARHLCFGASPSQLTIVREDFP
jgi:hypothetical protein